MKILIFNTLYAPIQIGGAEKSVQILAEALAATGVSPVVATVAERNHCEYVNGVKVYYLKPSNLYPPHLSGSQHQLKKPLWHIIDSCNPFAKNIKNVVESEQPDVVHTNNLAGFSPFVWHIAKQNNIKLVHTLRDYYLMCPKSTMFKNGTNCEKQCLPCRILSFPKVLLAKYVDNVVGISEFILNRHIAAGYFRNAARKVIYNPIVIPKSINRDFKRKASGIRFGFIGRIETAKGIEFLLRNFHLNNPLLIYGAGDNEYMEALKQKYGRSNIHFMGYQFQENIYRNIDILIVPSLWHEPFGRIVPEANSHNIPVLASKRGGLGELIEDGRNGYLFELSKQDFSDKLDMTVKSYINREFRFNTEKFKIEKIVKSYLDVYA